MPITFTPVGTTLDVNVIDQNFKDWQDLFRSGLQRGDFSGRFDRYRIRRWTSGRLVSASTHAFPYREAARAQSWNRIETFDLTYRRGREDSGDMDVVDVRRGSSGNAYAMELLGFPGPSFYWNWQEDGLNDPATAHGASGWPPSYYPVSRHPASMCFSRWLTIPGCSIKVFVPERAVARIKGNALGALAWYGMMRYAAAGGVILTPWQVTQYVLKLYHAGRFGLIVDTNPIVYSDEFVNINPNIIDPSTGSTASRKSWQVVTDLTYMMAQRENFHLRGEIDLKGGRWYNFRMAFRDAATHGWINHTPGTPTWEDDIWEDHVNDGTIVNAPTSTNWTAYDLPHPFHPMWVNLWEGTGLNVEFFYGRDQSYSSSTGDFTHSIKAV